MPTEQLPKGHAPEHPLSYDHEGWWASGRARASENKRQGHFSKRTESRSNQGESARSRGRASSHCPPLPAQETPPAADAVCLPVSTVHMGGALAVTLSYPPHCILGTSVPGVDSLPSWFIGSQTLRNPRKT